MEAASSSSSAPFPSSWDPGKLFVGGISWETGEAALCDYFKKYGEVADAVAVKDRATGKPRGFAFVLFSDPDAVDRALKDEDHHVILGRTVEVKRARPRSEQNQQENKRVSKSGANTNGSNNKVHTRLKKIFVGGLSSDVTEDSFRAYFEEFGRVTDVVVIYDNITHRSRGFGFIEFESEEVVEKVMQKSFHELNNKRVEIKIAVPKDGYNHRNTSNYNSNNYDSRMVGGVGYGFSNYQGGVYPTYGSGYGFFHGYAPPPVSGYIYGAAGYGGGYIIGGNDRAAYGAPFASPRVPWIDQGLVGARQTPVHYGSATTYPGYINGTFGGYYGVAGSEHHGMASGNDKGNQADSDINTTQVSETITSQVESLKLDARRHSH